MDLWLIILLSAVGGILLLVMIVLFAWMLCRKRKRSKLPKLNEGQNGKVWQAHDHIVEVDDEELHEDGLCKDTLSGSTFPRRVKKEEEQSGPEEDGLCKETKIRSTTLPRRGKMEDTWIKPVENGSHFVTETALKSVLPFGALATTIGSQDKVDDSKRKKKEPEVTDAIVHDAVVNEGVTMKDQPSHNDDTSSSSSSSSDDSEDKIPFKTRTSFKLERQRSKSLHSDLDVPIYTKPIKRAVSNPTFVAREKIIKADKRFESLKTWKESFPLPEPDYPLASYPPFTSKHIDDNDHVPLSNNTSDSGVEITESISGRDDDSETRSDSITESPGIPMPQLPKQDNEEGSFLSKELRSINYVETKEHTSFIDEQNNDYKVITNSDDTRSSTPAVQKETMQDKVSVNNLRNFIPDYPAVAESKGVLQHQTRKPTTEKKQTTSSWSTDAQSVDFRSVHLKPAAWNNYTSQDQAPVTTTSSTPTLKEDLDAKRVFPSSLVTESKSSKLVQPASDSTKKTAPSYTTKTTAINYKTSVTQNNYSPPTLNNQIDFRAFKLRPTPNDIKQHIGFKEKLQPSQTQSEKIQVNDSDNAEKRVEGAPLTNSNHDQGLRVSNLISRPTNSGVREKTSLNQNAFAKANGTIGNSSPSTNNHKSSDMVIIRLNEKEKPTPDNSAAPSSETTPKSPRRQTTGGIQSVEEKRKIWRREQIEQRLSTGLALSERQPLMQASGLAYRSCMPELFTKIKEIGDQKEDVQVN